MATLVTQNAFIELRNEKHDDMDLDQKLEKYDLDKDVSEIAADVGDKIGEESKDAIDGDVTGQSGYNKLNINAAEFVPRFKRNDDGQTELNLAALKRHFESMDRRKTHDAPIIKSVAALEQSLIKESLYKNAHCAPHWLDFPKAHMFDGKERSGKKQSKRVVLLDESNLNSRPHMKRLRREKSPRALNNGMGWDPELKNLCGRKFESEDQKREHERQVALEALKLVEQRRMSNLLEASVEKTNENTENPLCHKVFVPLNFSPEERERVDRLRISKRQRIERVLREMQQEKLEMEQKQGTEDESQNSKEADTAEAKQDSPPKSSQKADANSKKTANAPTADKSSATAAAGASKKKSNKDDKAISQLVQLGKLAKATESSTNDEATTNNKQRPGSNNKSTGNREPQQQSQSRFSDKTHFNRFGKPDSEKENFKQYSTPYSKAHPFAPTPVFNAEHGYAPTRGDYMRFKPYNPYAIPQPDYIPNHKLPPLNYPIRCGKYNATELHRNDPTPYKMNAQYQSKGVYSNNCYARGNYNDKRSYMAHQQPMLPPRVPHNTPTSTPTGKHMQLPKPYVSTNKFPRHLPTDGSQCSFHSGDFNDFNRKPYDNAAGNGSKGNYNDEAAKNVSPPAELQTEGKTGGKKTYHLSKLLEIKNEMAKTYAQVAGGNELSGSAISCLAMHGLSRSPSGTGSTSGLCSSLGGNSSGDNSARSYGAASVSSLTSSAGNSARSSYTKNVCNMHAAGPGSGSATMGYNYINPNMDNFGIAHNGIFSSKFNKFASGEPPHNGVYRVVKKSVRFSDLTNDNYLAEKEKSTSPTCSIADAADDKSDAVFKKISPSNNNVMRYTIADLMDMMPIGNKLIVPRISNQLRKFEFLRI